MLMNLSEKYFQLFVIQDLWGKSPSKDEMAEDFPNKIEYAKATLHTALGTIEAYFEMEVGEQTEEGYAQSSLRNLKNRLRG